MATSKIGMLREGHLPGLAIPVAVLGQAIVILSVGAVFFFPFEAMVAGLLGSGLWIIAAEKAERAYEGTLETKSIIAGTGREEYGTTQ